MNSIRCPRCGLVSFATAQDCKRCHYEFLAPQEAGASLGDQSLPAPNTNQTAQPAPFSLMLEYEAEATPIGGWLILFAIYLGVLLGLSILYIQMFVELVSSQVFQDLTTPGSEIYVSMFNPGITFEVIWLSGVAVSSILLLIRFFGKRSSFPRLVVILLATNIAASFIDYLIGLNVTNELTTKLAAIYGPSKAQQIIPSYLGMLVLLSMVISAAWLLYFRNSRRVESTFVL